MEARRVFRAAQWTVCSPCLPLFLRHPIPGALPQPAPRTIMDVDAHTQCASLQAALANEMTPQTREGRQLSQLGGMHLHFGTEHARLEEGRSGSVPSKKLETSWSKQQSYVDGEKKNSVKMCELASAEQNSRNRGTHEGRSAWNRLYLSHPFP